MNPANVLIVVAHPDDEVLGCGGMVSMLARRGIPVTCCILSGNAEVRRHRPSTAELSQHMNEALRIIGATRCIEGDFPNIQFNTVPHVKVVTFIEDAIVSTGANTIFTHHPNDLNDDHKVVSGACQAAARLFQRRPSIPPLRGLYYMEILSSTDWAFRQSAPFSPDSFMTLDEIALAKKIEALRAYKGVMRAFPHPRCEEILRGLAALRGGQSGRGYAEAFQTAYHNLEF